MNLDCKINHIVYKNPIWVASGTFGYGAEFADFVKLDDIGAIVCKTVTLNARIGNKPPRIIETPAGLLNSIGLENKGAQNFKQEQYAKLKTFNTKIIISIAGNSVKEFTDCIKILQENAFPAAFELNLSCPNVAHNAAKYKLIAQDPIATAQIITAAKQATHLPIIAKLTPNVTDIAEIAIAVERAGADAVALVNTYFGIAINAKTMRPILGNTVGGVSGPAIKPMALRAVWETYKCIKIPIIGIGGIVSGVDVAEFMLAGASAVQIGTSNLANPACYNNIKQEFIDYLKQQNCNAIDLIGKGHA
jgi:dihydroorotate dehydrogenase (NAD+) catalytic subunit